MPRITRVDMETAPGFHLTPGQAINLEPWEARLRAEAAFLHARNAFHGKPVRWREPGAIPDQMPPVIVIFDKEPRAMIAALPGQPRELVIGLAYYIGIHHRRSL